MNHLNVEWDTGKNEDSQQCNLFEFKIARKACKVWSMADDNNTRIIILEMLTKVIAMATAPAT